MSGKRNRSKTVGDNDKGDSENEGNEKEERRTKMDISPVGTPKKNTKQKGERSKKDEESENNVPQQSLSVPFQKRLRRFFKAYDPTKIESIPALIEKYSEREEAYMKKLIEKYGPEPPGRESKRGENPQQHQHQAKSGKEEGQSVPPSHVSPESLPMKERLERMFKHYAPEKIDNLDQLLADSKGKEEVLLARLVAKYGPEPEVQPKSRSEVKNELMAKVKAKQEQQTNNKDDTKAAGSKKKGGKEKSRGGFNASSSAFLGPLPAVAEQPGTFLTTLVKVINNVTGEKDKLCCITDKGELHLYSVRDPHSPAGNIRGTASDSSSNPPNPTTNKNGGNKTKQTAKDTVSDNNNNNNNNTFFNRIVPLDSLSVVVRQDTFSQESVALLAANALASVTRKAPTVYPPLTVAEHAHISEVRKQHLAATASHYTTFILRLDGKGIDGMPKTQSSSSRSSGKGKEEDEEQSTMEVQEAADAPSFEDDPLAAMAAESAKAEKERAKAAEKAKKDAETLRIQAEEASADAALSTSVSTWPYLVLRVPQQDVPLFEFALKQVFVLLQERAFYKQLVVKKVKDELVESKRKAKEAADKAGMEVRRSAARRELHALKVKAKKEKHRNEKENLRTQKKRRGRNQTKEGENRKRGVVSEEHNATNEKIAAAAGSAGDEDGEEKEEENANKTRGNVVRSTPSFISTDGNNDGNEMADLSDDDDDDDVMSESSSTTTTTASASSTVSTVGDAEVDRFLGIPNSEEDGQIATTYDGGGGGDENEEKEEPFYKRMARARNGGSLVARLSSSSSSALFPFSFLKSNNEKTVDKVDRKAGEENEEEEEGFKELEIIRTNPFSPNEDVIQRALVQQQKLIAEAAAAEEEMRKKLRRKAKYGSKKEDDDEEEGESTDRKLEGRGSFSSPLPRHYTTNTAESLEPQSRGEAVAEEMLKRALDPSKLPTNVRVEEKIAGIQPKNFMMTLRKTLQHGPAVALFSSSFAPLSFGGSAEKARRAAKKALQDRYELDEGPLRQRLTDFLRIVKPELVSSSSSSAPFSLPPPVDSQTFGSTSNRHDGMRDGNKNNTNEESKAVNSLPNGDDDDVVDGEGGSGATFIDALIGLYRGKERALFDDLCAEFKREANLDAIREALLAAEIAAEDIENMVAEDEEKMERALEKLKKYQKEQEEAAEAERSRVEAEDAAKREQEELAEAERMKAEDEAKLNADEDVAALAAEEAEKAAHEARMDEDHFLGWRESELYSQLSSRVGDVSVKFREEEGNESTVTIPNAFEKYLAVCTLLDGGLDDSDFFRVETELYAAAAAEKEKAKKKKKKEEAGAAEEAKEVSAEMATTTTAATVAGTTIDDDVWNETDETLLENFKRIQLTFEKERSRLKEVLGDDLFIRYTSRRQHVNRTNPLPTGPEATGGEVHEQADSLISSGGGGGGDACIFGTDTNKEIADYFLSAGAEEDPTAEHIGPTRKELREDPDHVGHDPHFNRKKGLLETGLSKFIMTGRRRIGRLAKHCSVPVLRRAFGPEWERARGKDQETSLSNGTITNENNKNNMITTTDYGSPLPYLETVFAKEIARPPPKKSDDKNEGKSNEIDPTATVLDHDNDLSSDALLHVRLARRELARVFKRRDETTAVETEKTKTSKKGTQQGKGSDQTELLYVRKEEEEEGAGFFEEELQENFHFSNVPDTISFVLMETVEAGSDEAVVKTEDATTAEEAARGETLTEVTTKKTTYFARVPKVVTVPNYLYLVKPLSVREKMRYLSSRRRSPIIDNYHHCINVVQAAGDGTEQQQQYMYNYGEGELEDARDREREDYYNLYPPGTAEEDMAWYEGSLLYEDMRPPRHVFAENVEAVEEGPTIADPPPPPTDDDDDETSSSSSYSRSSRSTRKTGSDGRITVDSFSIGEYPHRKRQQKKSSLTAVDGDSSEEEEDRSQKEYDPEFWESAKSVDGLLQINHWDVANALFKTSRRDYLRKRLEAGEGISAEGGGGAEIIGGRERGRETTTSTAESEADSSINLDDEAGDEDDNHSLNLSISSSSSSFASTRSSPIGDRLMKKSASSSRKSRVTETVFRKAQNEKKSNKFIVAASKQQIIPIQSTLTQTITCNSDTINDIHNKSSQPPNMRSGSLSGLAGRGTTVTMSAAASVFGPPLPLLGRDAHEKIDYNNNNNNNSKSVVRRDGGNAATKGGFFSNLAESLLFSRIRANDPPATATTIISAPSKKQMLWKNNNKSAFGARADCGSSLFPPKLGSLPTVAAPIIISDGLLLDMADDMLHFATNKMELAAVSASVGGATPGKETSDMPEQKSHERENHRQDPPFASSTLATMNIRTKLRREHALAADVAEVALLRQRIRQAISDRNALSLPLPTQQEEEGNKEGGRKAPRVAAGLEKEIVNNVIDNNDHEKEGELLAFDQHTNHESLSPEPSRPPPGVPQSSSFLDSFSPLTAPKASTTAGKENKMPRETRWRKSVTSSDEKKRNENPTANGFFKEQSAENAGHKHNDDDDVSPDGSIESCMLPLPPLNPPPPPRAQQQQQFQPMVTPPTPLTSDFPPPPYPLDTYGNGIINPKTKRLSSSYLASVEDGSDVSATDFGTGTTGNYDLLLEPLSRSFREPLLLFSASKNKNKNGTAATEQLANGTFIHKSNTIKKGKDDDADHRQKHPNRRPNFLLRPPPPTATTTAPNTELGGQGNGAHSISGGRNASPDTILDQLIGVVTEKPNPSPSPFSKGFVVRAHDTDEGQQQSGPPSSSSSSNISLSSWMDSPNHPSPSPEDDVI